MYDWNNKLYMRNRCRTQRKANEWKKKKRKIVQIDIEVIPEKESRVSPEKIRTYWRIRISKELTCPSEYQQWWNNHNERGFVYTDQTYSHLVHLIPDRNSLYSDNNIPVSIILIFEQPKRTVKFKHALLNRKLCLLWWIF